MVDPKHLIMIIILIVVIVVGIVMKYNKKTEKWGTAQIGMGAYPNDSAFTYTGAWHPDMTSTKLSTEESTGLLLNKWYNFAGQLSPDVSESIYMLFPDLQTQQSIQYYGLTKGMVDTLNLIKPKLRNPEELTSLEAVNKRFAKDALKRFSIDTDTENTSGLYNDVKKYGNYIDVY